MKFKKLPYALAFLLAMVFFGEVSSQISASNTEGCAPLIGVEFSHSFSGATNVLWDFGNGGSAVVDNPTTTFQLPGVYTVVFTADGGIQETMQITVLASPEASFSTVGVASGCIPLSVSFTDESVAPPGSQIVNWSWDFGDGGVQTGANPSPSHVYSLVGINDVTVVVEDNNGCDASFTIDDLVVASIPPALQFVSDPSNLSACDPPLAVNFSAVATSNSPLSDDLTYAWDIDGTTYSVANPPVQNYTEDGAYPLSVVVTDDAGCESSVNQSVFIGSPEAGWELLGGPSFCDTVYFVNHSDPATTQVNWGDGQTENLIGVVDTIMHVYTGSGTFESSVTASSPGCESTESATVIIDELEADFVSSPNFSCNPTLTTTYESTSVGAESYMWVFGSETIFDTPITDYTHQSAAQVDPYLPAGPETFGGTLHITSAAGCTASVAHYNDSIWRPHAAFAVDIVDGCLPLTVNFSDSSSAPVEITNWAWHMGDGSIVETSDTDFPTEYTYNTAGDFDSFLVITTEEGCVDTSYFIPIEVGDLTNPELNFGPVQVCPGEPVDFSAVIDPGDDTDMWSVQTDNGQMSGCPYSPDTSGGLTSSAGFQDVTIMTSYNGCVSTNTYSNAIEVLGPVGHFRTELNCEDPFTVEFIGTITGADSWTYDFGDGNVFTSSSDESTTYTYSNTGDYDVVLTSVASTGCGPFTDTVHVKIKDVRAVLAEPELYCVGATVMLDATASQDVQANCNDGYIWMFDSELGLAPYRSEDGVQMIEVNESGTFTIDLVVQDANGCADTAQTVLSVYGVDVDIDFETQGACLPMDVAFVDMTVSDTTIVQWLWDFGSGNESDEINPSFVFDESMGDFFNVTLTVTDTLGCTGAASVSFGPDIPSAAFSGSNFQMCSGETMVLSAAIEDYPFYEWTVQDVVTGSDSEYAAEYDTGGTYDVMLVVENDAGCVDSVLVEDYFSVQEVPDVGFSSTADGLVNLCYPILIEFTDTTDAWVFDYLEWDLGTGFPVIDNTTVGTIYDTPGTYTVSLEVGTTFGCVGFYEEEIFIEGPVADFVMSTDELCFYESVTVEISDSSDVAYYMWDFGNGVDSAMANPLTFFYDQIPFGGSTNVQLITWSADSACFATTQYPIQVNQTIADFNRNDDVAFEDTVHCFGIQDVFTNLSIDATNYLWDLGNGYQTANPEFNYRYPVGGEFMITLYANNAITGCSDTLAKPIQIYPEMHVGVDDGLACDGDTIFLAAFGGEQYEWSPPLNVNDPTSQFPYVIISENSDMSVLITDTNYCSQTLFLDADYIFEPAHTQWNDTVIDYGTMLNVSYDTELYHYYNWTSSSGNNCSTCGTDYFYPGSSDVFTLTVTDELNCFEESFSFNVTVLSDLLFYMPNAFTPNGDGINDYFHPVMTRYIDRNYLFSIWDRSGNLIWETTDPSEKWEGSVNRSNYFAETEVFVWKVRVNSVKSIAQEFTGSVTLVR